MTAQPYGNISPYSRTTALLLCIFLGAFGAHHFYVGKSGSGTAILILTLCTGLGSIWAFVDMIMILTGTFTDNFNRFVSSWDGGTIAPAPQASVTYQSPPPVYTAPQPSHTPPPPQKNADEIFCKTCGALCKKHETFCRNCGTALQL